MSNDFRIGSIVSEASAHCVGSKRKVLNCGCYTLVYMSLRRHAAIAHVRMGGSRFMDITPTLILAWSSRKLGKSESLENRIWRAAFFVSTS